jgi:hypothetical protein
LSLSDKIHYCETMSFYLDEQTHIDFDSLTHEELDKYISYFDLLLDKICNI